MKVGGQSAGTGSSRYPHASVPGHQNAQVVARLEVGWSLWIGKSGSPCWGWPSPAGEAVGLDIGQPLVWRADNCHCMFAGA